MATVTSRVRQNHLICTTILLWKRKATVFIQTNCSFFRHYRAERELQSRFWKIDYDELCFEHRRGSNTSLASTVMVSINNPFMYYNDFKQLVALAHKYVTTSLFRLIVCQQFVLVLFQHQRDDDDDAGMPLLEDDTAEGKTTSIGKYKVRK